MTITAETIADSVSPAGVRLTTLALRYPRFVHAEVMTHRAFSRNASSSRAIPFMRALRDIVSDPAVPVHWGRNQTGMQARAEVSGWRRWVARRLWLAAMWTTAGLACVMHWLGVHKQVVNRLIEPWAHITVLVTATDWANFFALRDHPDAQPEIAALAKAMRAAMDASKPVALEPGEWHLPYVGWQPASSVGLKFALMASAARCARVSYLTHEGQVPTTDADVALYRRLVKHDPMHASPTEHQATPDTWDACGWDMPWQHGNLHGWRQHRKLLDGECADEPNRPRTAAEAAE